MKLFLNFCERMLGVVGLLVWLCAAGAGVPHDPAAAPSELSVPPLLLGNGTGASEAPVRLAALQGFGYHRGVLGMLRESAPALPCSLCPCL